LYLQQENTQREMIEVMNILLLYNEWAGCEKVIRAVRHEISVKNKLTVHVIFNKLRVDFVNFPHPTTDVQ